MNSALIPAVVAALGGSALGLAIVVYEWRTAAAMTASRVRLALVFPAGLEPLAAKAALAGLSGLDWQQECILEVDADADGVRYYLLVPAAVRASAEATLRGAIPSIRITEATVPAGRATIAATVYVPTPIVLATDDPRGASRTLLAGLVNLTGSERAILRWAIRGGAPRAYTPREPLDKAARVIESAWRQKVASGPGFQVAGLLLVRAGSVGRARQILDHLTASLRSRRGAVGALRISTERSGRSLAATPKTALRRSGWLTNTEALALVAWPLGEAIPGVAVGASRELVVPDYVPRAGRRLLVGRDRLGHERPVALTSEPAHVGLFGGTGSGKTTAAIQLILSYLAEGIGGVFCDPKDAIPTLLDHVPVECAERVTVIDPLRPGPVPGLDLFGTGDDAQRSEVLLSLLKGVSDGWGPRIQRYLRLGFQAMPLMDDPVLFDWLRLFANPELRRGVVSRITDPVLAGEWRSYEEQLGAAEQAAFTAPAIARITELLSRPALRAVLSQPGAAVNIEDHLAEGRWLCISLSPALGQVACDLLAGIVVYLTWAAIEKRVSIPEGERRPAVLVLDELQSLAHLPVGPEVFLERTRSLSCSVIAVTQAVSRLPEPTQRSLFANLGSIVAFRSGPYEAKRLAPALVPLTAADLAGLGRYEVAARVSTGPFGSGSAVVTGRTEPLPAATGQAERIYRLSAERYGREPSEVDDLLRQRDEGAGDGTDQSGGFGRTRRAA